MIKMGVPDWSGLERIDFGIRVNYLLVEDGRHPAVDYDAVWAHINELLDRRLKITERAAIQRG